MALISAKKLRLELSTSRIEALTDGVFAIAMTLLVLNIEVSEPRQDLDPSKFRQQVLGLWPHLIHYLESFIILAAFWIKNHQQFHFIKRSDRRLLWINLGCLMFVCLIPFSTSLMTDYGEMRLAAMVFESNMLLAGALYYLHWSYATKGLRLVEKDLDPRVITVYKQSSLVIPVIAVVAILLSIIHPRWGTGVFFLIPFILFLMEKIEYVGSPR